MRRGMLTRARRGALGLVWLVLLPLGCGGIPATVQNDVGIKAEEDLPIRFEDVMPVNMVSDVPITFEEIPPVRIEQPVPVQIDESFRVRADESIPVTVGEQVPVSVRDTVAVSAAQDMPVRVNRPVPVSFDERVPVVMSEGVSISASQDMPVRLSGTVPVSFAGPITLNLNLGDVDSEGTYISEELFALVEPGATTLEWTEAVFGPPTRRTQLGDDSQILVWRYRPLFTPGVFVSLQGDAPEEPAPIPILVFIRFVDGVVADKWRG